MKTPSWNSSNDLPTETRTASILLLNAALADLIDLGLQAKQAHWNVKGPAFFSLHEVFDKVAAEIGELTDELAERAVALGGVALGTVQAVHHATRLPTYPTDIFSGDAQVAALGTALTGAARTLRAAIDSATNAGDADTADVFTQASRSADKLLWLIEAHRNST